VRTVTSHGEDPRHATFDRSGTLLVTAGGDGLVRVGPVDESAEPHLLFGHEGEVQTVAVSHDGKRIASVGFDGTLRIWPMPTGTPFHTLPRDELLAKLRALTNVRAVEDDESANGYRLDLDPFPGWENVPTW